jgi:pimeloyl-ACP methyl ester carboxylesterase
MPDPGSWRRAYVFGTSSGACLALEAAIQLGKKFKKLTLYEPPYNSDGTTVQEWKNYRKKLNELLAAEMMPWCCSWSWWRLLTRLPDALAPVWAMFEASPHPWHDAIIGEDRSRHFKRAANISVPTLADGGAILQYAVQHERRQHWRSSFMHSSVHWKVRQYVDLKSSPRCYGVLYQRRTKQRLFL